MKLFSDKALISLFNMCNQNSEVNNKYYTKLKTLIRSYPDDSRYYKAKIVPYDIIEEFRNCPDFLDYGMSCRKIEPKEDGTERRFYRISVLPIGGKRRSYYRFIVEDFDERMLDRSILED